MINIVKGNILNTTEDIIGHQVNCMGKFNAGLAKQIRSKYPFAYECYMGTWKDEDDKQDLMGRIKSCKMDDGKTITHVFSQFGYGRDKRYTDYDSLRKGLKVLEIVARNSNRSVALPHGIGCGLAGGQWDIVYKIIDKVFKDYEVTLYKFN